MKQARAERATDSGKMDVSDLDNTMERAPGIWVVPNSAQKVLGVDPAALLNELQQYPKRLSGEAIVPGVVQWVDGETEAL